MKSRRRVTIVVVLAAALVVLGIVGAVLALSLGANRTSPAPTLTPGATATSTAPPALVPGGTAADDLPYFDAVNRALIAKGGTLNGRAFVDNLVAAGFDKAAMELTPDTTSAGLKADNIEFSVWIGDSCLIGQYGTVGYASTVQRKLGTGVCLVGNTRRIDW